MQVALVIEDDPETLIAWAFVLRSFGFTVLEAVSRGQAWRVCHEYQGTIHLVVTKAIFGNHRTSDFMTRLRLVYPQIRALFVSPIFPGSQIRMHSGMVMQVDVIPFSSTYFSTRMEDGIVIADKDLQGRVRALYPDCFARCVQRREFMRNTLGIEVADEVLPLSNMPAIVPPYFFSPNQILVMGK